MGGEKGAPRGEVTIFRAVSEREIMVFGDESFIRARQGFVFSSRVITMYIVLVNKMGFTVNRTI